MKKNYFFIVILFLSMFFSSKKMEAQILNTDRTKSLDSSENVLTRVAVSIATDQQKKFLVDFYYTGDFTFLNKKNATTFYSKIDKVTNGGQSIQNLGTFQLKNSKEISSQFHIESFIQYQWDASLGMEYRNLAGLNLIHYFKNTEWEDFFWGAGIFLENEKWNWSAVNEESLINNKSIIITHPKLNLTAKYSVVHPTNHYEFILRIFNQTGTYEDKINNRTSVFNQFQLPITKKLSTSFNLDFLYDTHPVVPIDHFHYNYYQTLSYSF